MSRSRSLGPVAAFCLGVLPLLAATLTNRVAR